MKFVCRQLKKEKGGKHDLCYSEEQVKMSHQDEDGPHVKLGP